ncbi:cob(I)yrinic acid a,c-diamide adenosyltransferase [Haloactinopolyspora alba]|uniref:Cob(I)yrinic acid a,c-diamide adenosyltransferase n=1 Tax=Haloactinopolyspora alba TaxID=648780 RepID=A0A2P8E6Q7_9ACTN|nr:cob(I)yrinic acid a,c-diamide adenosyltransferase [Haloactinopolyspora alba]PSL05154.1 cob(I)yrinic acid a,c-diamide adenosyltransferase [Haloactinopolyspora alba]
MNEEPRTAPPQRPQRVNVPSVVLVNTGDGKGKSTAAFGVAMRSLARDWPVAVVQFIKSDQWRTGEEAVLRRLGADWWSLGDGFSWESDDLDESQRHAVEAWRHTRGLLRDGVHRTVLLDEITYPMNWGWIDTTEVVEAIRGRAETVNVVCTGRDAPQPLTELADTVTEMHKVTHAFDRGIMARRGIDF